MNASYTILTPTHRRRRRWFGRRRQGGPSWLAAMAILAIGVPAALGVSSWLLETDDDEVAAALPVAELTLPSLPPPASAPSSVTEASDGGEPAAAVEAPAQTAEVTLPVPPAVVDPADPETDPARRVVRLEWGDTLIGLLLEAAVPEAEAHEAMAALRKVYDPRDVQAGEEVVLRYGDTGHFEGFEFEPSAERSVRVERHGEGFKAASVLRPLSHNVMAATATIDGSLYESGIKAGVPASTMSGLVKALSYNIDFQRDIKAGDSFKVLFEVLRNPDGQLVRTGEILYAEIKLQDRVVPVYRYRFADGRTEYFDRSGNSVRKAIMRTPVNAARISSGFGMRVHPVLGYSRMHKGMDFAAPPGTPIYAAGDGEIVERGVKNGYGNYIRIKHNNTLQTAYAHMSRFNASFSRGSRVRQGQVIGYVGSTGRSTGPHLHFEVMVNGAQVNPLRVANMSTGEKLARGDLNRLQGIIRSIDEQFKEIEPGRAIEAAFNATTGEAIRTTVQ